MKKICVIVPVYNVERYIKKCVDSIINQTFLDFDLFLIDDGSKDNSGIICDQYAKKYKNVFSFHKENGGLSDARNYGLERQNAEYLTFIDSDDYIESHFLEELYHVAITHKADLVISGLRNVYDYNSDRDFDISLSNQIELTREEAYKRMLLQQGCDVSAVGKLYKSEIFRSIRYPKGMLYEDIQIIDQIIETAEHIVFDSYKGYCYYQRSGSIMYGKMSKERLVLIEACNYLIALAKEKYPTMLDACIWRYINCNFHLLGRSILDNKYLEYSKQFKDNILQYESIVLTDPLYTKKQRLATQLLSMGLPIYKLGWKLFCIIKGKKME